MYKGCNIFLFFATLMALSCKESYNPIVTTSNNNILVVEGFINTIDSTFINLSRTVVLANKNTTVNPETGAVVSIESESNETFTLKEEKKGIYNAPPLSLNANKKYRLRIKTNNGSTYLSDFVQPKVSPAIENIGFDIKSNGVQVYANTKDLSNNSIYYRWEYEETWIFYSKYRSNVIYDKVYGIRPRQATAENIYQCWGNGKSNKIVLASSAKLSQDVIFQAPIIFIPSDAEKLEEKYSILVKQYVLTKEAYHFWENLRKNTESLGSIFDAQPSQLTGNIHNISNAEEPIIGFISAGTIQQQRVYITKDKLPKWTATYPFNCSSPEEVLPLFFSRFSGSDFVPLEFTANGITGVERKCADCTIRGTITKPSFWQ